MVYTYFLSPEATAVSKEKKAEKNKSASFYSLLTSLFINGLRDMVWTLCSVNQWNLSFEETPDNFGEDGEWLAQQIYPMFIMAAASILITTYQWSHQRALKKEDEQQAEQSSTAIPWKETLSFFIGSSMGIIAWNIAQDTGKRLFLNSDMDDVEAGLAASLLTGVFEGITQHCFIRLTTIITNNQDERENLKNNCREYLKNFFKESLYSITVGAVPGAVWQAVYVIMTQVAQANPALTILAVPTSVCISNVVVEVCKKPVIDRVCTSTFFCQKGKEETKLQESLMQSPFSSPVSPSD